MDVGQPKDYLSGTCLYLNAIKKSGRLATGDGLIGSVLIDSTACIGQDCKIGPNVVIGPNVIIGNGKFHLEFSTVALKFPRLLITQIGC